MEPGSVNVDGRRVGQGPVACWLAKKSRRRAPVPGDAAPSSRKVGKEELSVFVEKERVSRVALRDVGGNGI
jgi:hypothetical protein